MRRKFIALVLTVCLISAGVIFVWQGNNHAILSRVESTLGDELSSALDAKFEAGRIEITGWNSLELHDFTLYDKQGQKMITGGTISVSVNVFDLLRGRSVIETLTDVKASGSALFLRRGAGGRWNIEDFTEKKREEAAVFHGRLIIKNSSIQVLAPEGQWLVDDIQGEADFSLYPAIAVTMQGSRGQSAAQIKGTVNTQGRSGVEITADNIVIDDYLAALPVVENGALMAGLAEHFSAFVQVEKNSFAYTGEMTFKKLAGRVERFSVQGASGKAAFTEKSLQLFDTTANIDGQPLEINGRIDFAGSEPEFNVTAASPAFDVQAFLPEIPLQGPITFWVHLTGTPSFPIVEGTVSLPQGEIQGYELSDVAARIHFADQTLTVEDARAAVFGGRMTVTGQWNSAEQTAQFHISGRQIAVESLAGLAAAYSLPVSGTADFQADVFAAGAGYSAIHMTGTAALENGEVNGIPLTNAYTGFSWQDGLLALDYLTVDIDGGSMIAAGGLDNNGWNLTVRGQDLQLAFLKTFMPDLDIAGKASFSGTVTGKRDEPEFQGSFSATDGQLLFQPFRQALGQVRINRHTAAIFGGRLQDGVTSHEAAGTIGLDGQRPVELTLISRRARAENLVKLLAPGEQLTGNVDNEILISGSLDNLNASGG